MTRNPRQKALYEVIKSTQKRPIAIGFPPEAAAGDSKDSSEKINTQTAPEKQPDKKRKPVFGFQPARKFGYKPVLLIPYRVAVVLVLVILLSVWTAYKIGRLTNSRSVNNKAVETNIGQSETDMLTDLTVEQADQSTETEAAAENPPRSLPSAYKGDNVIVIATYRSRNDLELVQEYFAGNGIETEIWLRNNYFYLVTKDRFESTERRGGDGYLAKEQIKKIGADYKAPPGYETFKPNLFQDVYGMKVE